MEVSKTELFKEAGIPEEFIAEQFCLCKQKFGKLMGPRNYSVEIEMKFRENTALLESA